jgi:nicotinate-nucleotide pyrophosphorylase (carboxylating)
MKKKTAKPLSPAVRRLLKAALEEDTGSGDKTARLLIPPQAKGRARIIAREEGVFSGVPAAQELCRIASLKAHFLIKEGGAYSKNQTLLILEGRVHSILKLERTLLNFIARLSGIASLTQQFVEKVQTCPVPLLDTRKTTPLWRELEKAAVRAGGGVNHRMGLYDYILVKENHRLHGDLSKLRQVPEDFEIEVRNLNELREALKLRPAAVLLDNFSPSALKTAVSEARKINPRVILEASGGITLNNVLQYACAGVDRISIGSLTHSVRSANFSLLMEEP